MQSVNQQLDFSHDTPAMNTAEPVVTQPSRIHEVDYVKATEEHLAKVGIRNELAAAFRKLGRGVNAAAAYQRAKAFYKSSGHRWARGLR